MNVTGIACVRACMRAKMNYCGVACVSASGICVCMCADIRYVKVHMSACMCAYLCQW